MSWERSHLQPAVVDKALIVCLLRQTQYRTPLLEAEVAVERLSFVAEIWIELKLVVHAHHTRLLQQRLGEEEAHGSERVTHPLILTNGDQVVYADKADVRLVELERAAHPTYDFLLVTHDKHDAVICVLFDRRYGNLEWDADPGAHQIGHLRQSRAGS